MSQGIQHPENFGFICRDVVSENNVCYVFKCQNNSVADEIMTGQSNLFYFFSILRVSVLLLTVCCLVLKLASHSASESQKRIHGNLCDHCPAVWLQRLMTDVEGPLGFLFSPN